MRPTDKSYEYWRIRILYSTMFGYILFYFIRKNLSMAMPGIEEDLGITKAELGIFLTAHGLLYGVSKLVNGIIADRANPRYFMTAGLLICAVANFGFGMSGSVWLMGLFWVVNGWFQGMGYPPCAKSLSHWFSPYERGIAVSIWNTSHSFGAGLVFLLNAWIIWYFQDWRFCFFVPAMIALVGAFLLFERLRDTPESLGFEPIEHYELKKRGDATDPPGDRDEKNGPEEPWGRMLYTYAFSNPAIWIVSIANFFIYVVRFSILDWAPTFLKQSKGIEIHNAGIIGSVYELVGVLGMLLSGWLMDRVFHGRGVKVCFLYMLGCTVTMALFWWADSDSVIVNACILAVLGFFIYGPQCLVGAVIANLATKKVASAAIGLAGFFGYMSVIVTGYGVGLISDRYGWNTVFFLLIIASFLGTVLFLFAFNSVSPEQIAMEKEKKSLEKDKP